MVTNFLFHPKVIARLQGCNHCVCTHCLKTLMESSKGAKDSTMRIDCPVLRCSSFVAVKVVEEFLGDRGNPQKAV